MCDLVGKTCQECWELEPSAGARIPPLWASLDRKPPGRRLPTGTGRPIAVAGSPPHLRGKPPRCGHRAPRCRRWSYASQMPRSKHNFAIQPLLSTLSWSFLPSRSCSCWNLLLLFSETQCTQCNWMQCTNYELQGLKARTLAVRYGCHGASAHWSPRKQPRGLGFWTHGYWWKHKVFHEIMRFFIFSEWFRAFAEVPLFKSPNVIKCFFDRSNHDSTCHILSSHTHTKHDISYSLSYSIINVSYIIHL